MLLFVSFSVGFFSLSAGAAVKKWGAILKPFHATDGLFGLARVGVKVARKRRFPCHLQQTFMASKGVECVS